MDVAYSRHGEDEKCIFLVGECERRRPVGRPRRKWRDNIKLNLREIGCEKCGLALTGST
jgi:hypothetical protein